MSYRFRKIFFLLALLPALAVAQKPTELRYRVKSAMIPMRDGVKLYTAMLIPVRQSGPVPFLIQRTPYGVGFGVPDDSTLNVAGAPNYGPLAESGYMFVFQDVRGKNRSEGTMEIHQPLVHLTQPGKVDESTDTYDTIEWLLKNIPNNNGKAGIFGISYPGWLALVGAVDPHPALKASSEQACMGDLFLGDDFHHNGAFRLSYGFEYTYSVEGSKEGEEFKFPQYDLYDWYRNLGSLKNVNAKYFKGKIPTWNHFVEHPNYDAFWQKDSPLSYVRGPEVPQLHVGGYYDQEDVNGPQLMYTHMEKADTKRQNYIVLGPWYHGQWASAKGDSLGKIAFGTRTAPYFQDIQRRWFDYHLKGIGDGTFAEATCFQTGSNQWKTYTTWPPKEATPRQLYASADGTCSFTKPTGTGFVSYPSDPQNPVPYRSLPIEQTYGPGSRWRAWHVDDQRFVYGRPDVVSFKGAVLSQPLTVTGAVKAHLFASTSQTDADWVVKLIDVYPDYDSTNRAMSGYQLPVAMEVFRGRFRKSFEKPEPLRPNQPEEFVIDLHQINHTFRPGHRLMIQVQSTWFPVIDRNPQKYVPNIFEADERDFTKAEHRIYTDAQRATYLELPVMER
jgi:putative CocE/NonD family hydrolase